MPSSGSAASSYERASASKSPCEYFCQRLHQTPKKRRGGSKGAPLRTASSASARRYSRPYTKTVRSAWPARPACTDGAQSPDGVRT